MDKAVAISMKNHYLNYYRHFDHYRLEELDLKTIGSDVYKHINFLFFRNNSTLIITGDFGDAIFKWYSSENTLEDIAKYVKMILVTLQGSAQRAPNLCIFMIRKRLRRILWNG